MGRGFRGFPVFGSHALFLAKTGLLRPALRAQKRFPELKKEAYALTYTSFLNGEGGI